MIILILSIFSSTLIFALFRYFPRFKVDTFQAIVFNYLTAFCCGILLYGNEWKPAYLVESNWPFLALLTATLFISLFLLIGISSQKNGIGLTSVVVKMSMSVSMLFMLVIYHEPLSALKIGGILLAFAGVFLSSFDPDNKLGSKKAGWMLPVLFFGSGLLDLLLNYAQKFALIGLSASLYSAFGLGLAGIFGSLILILRIILKKTVFHWRNVLAGIILGIPNYFSIYWLIRSYKATGWNDSTVLAVTNVGVVLLSAFAGLLIFREKFPPQKLIGLFVSLAAIAILYLSTR